MSRILIAWELGADLGHLSMLLPIALELQKRGHQPVFVIRDISNAESILGRHGFEFLQAPIMSRQGKRHGVVSYAEILSTFGYTQPDILTGYIKAWRNLFAMVKPDIVLFEHAPTALLAAVDIDVKRIHIGTGFTVPPMMNSIPHYTLTRDVPASRVMESEQRVLAGINTVLAKLNSPTLEKLSDLFAVDKTLICSFPELDHYPVRQSGNYIGLINTLGTGAEPVWPDIDGPRIFCYVKPQVKPTLDILNAIVSSRNPSVVYAPGLSTKDRQHFMSGNIYFSNSPVDMQKVLTTCDMVVCHGGHATVAYSLLAGKPLLIVPSQSEQAIMAARVESLGAGLALKPSYQPRDIPGLINKIAGNETYSNTAKAFARKYATFNMGEAVSELCDTVLNS